VERHQWQISGAVRHLFVQLPSPASDDAVIELQLPVRAAGSTEF
jgi:hypothetical protein